MGGALLAIGVVSPLAMAQRGDETPPPAREPGGPMFDRDAMRARAQRRIEELERELARMKDLLARFDRGEEPAPGGHLRSENARKGEMTPRERMREAMERRRGDERGRGPGGPPKGNRDGGLGDAVDYESLRPRMLENAPKVVEMMDRLRERNREVADRVWQRMIPRMKEAATLRERDPEGFRLKADEVSAGLGVILAMGDLREAQGGHDEAALAAKRAALREAVAKHVDTRIATQRHEVEALGQRLADLRKSLDAQVQDREKTIEERAKKMEDSPEGMMGNVSERPPRPAPAKK